MVFGFLFTLIAVVALIALLVTKSGADTTTQEFSITNINPAIPTLTISSTSFGTAYTPVTLLENVGKTIYVHGTASDQNGCGQIDVVNGSGLGAGVTDSSLWTGRFYRTNLAGGQDCTPNQSNCYWITMENADLAVAGRDQCTDAGGGSDQALEFEFDQLVNYYADATDANSVPDYSATDWTAYISIIDDQGGSTSATATTEVATLSALDTVTSAITYAATAWGDTTPQKSITIENTGNYNALDPMISQEAVWACNIGVIPIGNVKWSIVSDQDPAYDPNTDQTTLTNVATAINLNITKSQTGVPGPGSEGTFYTRLTVPNQGIGGTCNSTLTLGV